MKHRVAYPVTTELEGASPSAPHASAQGRNGNGRAGGPAASDDAVLERDSAVVGREALPGRSARRTNGTAVRSSTSNGRAVGALGGRSEENGSAGRPLNIVVLGLSISSSWGNGHASTYRSLLREMRGRGHAVTFLERDVPWYSTNRDLADPPYCRLRLYEDLDELRNRYESIVSEADVVIVGSFVPEGVPAARWVLQKAGGATAFYDIDTPVTLAKIERGDYEYIAPELIPEFDLYLSFTGGQTLDILTKKYGAQKAAPLYCSVDPTEYFPLELPARYDLGYMGTYSDDRQPRLERRMFDAARGWPRGRFIVAGPGYPDDLSWPTNVERVHHLPPSEHRRFYNSQRFTLNITRVDMVRLGHAPSVRLFEAAACGVPIISDYWDGIETIFRPGREILISESGGETLDYLRRLPEEERREIGKRARNRVLSAHTAAHRAAELERYLIEVIKQKEMLPSE